jgi:hypothetical protein
MMETTTPPITREAALRVALAARAMPAVTLPRLLELLQRRLGDDIDEEKLRQVTVTMLKTGFASVDGEEDGEDIGIGLEAMKLAVRILWGETQGDDSLPTRATCFPGISVPVCVFSSIRCRRTRFAWSTSATPWMPSSPRTRTCGAPN